MEYRLNTLVLIYFNKYYGKGRIFPYELAVIILLLFTVKFKILVS